MQMDLKEGLKSFKASYLKKSIEENQFTSFKENLIEYYSIIDKNRDRDEEHLKNITNDFLKNAFYSKPFLINTEQRIDSAIVKDNKTLVILEFKKPNNINEMIQIGNINKKALHETILYYLNERKNKSNIDLKNIVITDTINWFIFNAQDFERLFYKPLHKEYEKFINARLAISKNEDFYSQVIQPFFKDKESELDFIYFNLDEIFKKKNNLTEIKHLYKFFNPDFLIKEYNPQDVNILNKNFYDELLYIMGLKEETEKSKTVIKRNVGLDNSFLDVVYKKLISEKNITKEDAEDVALELVINWINRILFIKLFESQLIAFNNNNQAFEILNNEKIQSLKELNDLFLQVLNKRIRDEEYKKFDYIPYLNSSLFEISDYEDRYFAISSIENNPIKPKDRSNIKKWDKYKKGYTPKLLEYLLDFLKSYSFSAHVENDLVKENEEIVNASVLGLIFEKINGYKDGAVYTPSLITEYMAQEIIEKVVIDKFNEKYSQNCNKLDEVRFIIQTQFNSIEKRKEISELINSIKICDPAVGSGHFLVSSLNQLIAIKYYLRAIFKYGTNDLLNEYDIFVEDDVLTIIDGEDRPFVYDKINKLSQQIQQTIFNEKKGLIENCLFGVDINSKSVQICRLRLWIELLKNAYYNPDGTMETLPNIDINIKHGNSLISRIPYKVGEKIIKGVTDNSLKELINEYKTAVKKYKDPDKVDNSKEFKRLVNNRIQEIKRTIAGKFTQQLTLLNLQDFKDPSKIEKKKKTVNLGYSDEIFNNSMEWAIEFPEILDNEGVFLGFDLVIGNPPYIDSEEMVKSQPEVRTYCSKKYLSAKGNWDLYIPFFELGFKIIGNQKNLTFIIPNKCLSIAYGKTFRELYLNNFEQICRCDKINVFEAGNSPVILFFKKNLLNKELNLHEYDENKQLVKLISTNKNIIKNDNWGLLLSDNIDLLIKIMANNTTIQLLYDVENPFSTSEAYEIIELLEDRAIINNDFKLINTGTIDKYINYWGIKITSYLKNKFNNPVIDKECFKKYSEKRFTQAKSRKIIITGMRHFECFLDEYGDYIAGKSTIIVNGNNLRNLLGLLNSKLISFYIKQAYSALGIDGGINFSKDMVNNLPIPNQINIQIKDLVNKILELIHQDNYFNDEQAQGQVLEYQKEIDKLVYELYDLNDEEIGIIEGA